MGKSSKLKWETEAGEGLAKKKKSPKRKGLGGEGKWGKKKK